MTAAPDGIDFLLVTRPEVPIQISGRRDRGWYSGLVDTGSDHTILPTSIARDLGIDVNRASGPSATVFSGQLVHLHSGEATFMIESEEKSLSWIAEVCLFDFVDPEDEAIALGHAGFLEYFTAVFDGKLEVLDLIANDDLPSVDSP